MALEGVSFDSLCLLFLWTRVVPNHCVVDRLVKEFDRLVRTVLFFAIHLGYNLAGLPVS